MPDLTDKQIAEITASVRLIHHDTPSLDSFLEDVLNEVDEANLRSIDVKAE